MLTETAMIDCDRVHNKVAFVKYCPDLKVFSRDRARNVFQVTFHMDGDFQNSRRLKNTFLESSYKAVK